MALSQERDQLEGELSRMPEGSGRTLEQRRKKANAEKRLEEVLKASSAARHQLKAANRNWGTPRKEKEKQILHDRLHSSHYIRRLRRMKTTRIYIPT